MNKSAPTDRVLLAKAAILGANGKVQIIAIFQDNDYHNFFNLFEARSARSPRRSWRARGTQGIYKGMEKYHTIESYVQTLNYKALPFRIIYYKKRATLARYIAVQTITRQEPVPGTTFTHKRRTAAGEIRRDKYVFTGSPAASTSAPQALQTPYSEQKGGEIA